MAELLTFSFSTNPSAASCEQDFDAIVMPLELAAGKRLNGAGRLKCLAAFRENPDGFRIVADDALARAKRNVIGLLIRMIEDGEHGLAGHHGRLERALAWARKTAPRLSPEAQDDVIADFRLGLAAEAEVRSVLEFQQYTRPINDEAA